MGGKASSESALSDLGVAISEEGHNGGCLGGCKDAGPEDSVGLKPIANAASGAGLLLERELTIFFKDL